MKQIWAPWRMEYIGAAPPSEGCVLCAIGSDASHPQARHVVDRDAATFTVLNLYPYSSGHVMVVPREHRRDISELGADRRAAIMEAADRACRALRAALGCQGLNLGINQGGVAGAGIADHVHLHVVPRWNGDTNFMPVLADTKVLPEHLDATAERLRAAFDGLPPG